MELLLPNLGTFFWTALTFVILLLILKKTAWKPILDMLEEREQKIKESLEKADAAQKETEAALAKNQEIMDQAKKEAQELLSKSRKMAESTKEDIVKKADDEATKIVSKAKKEIALEKEKAIDDLRSQAAELSVMIASKIIGKSLSVDDHKEIIESSLKNMVEAN